MVPCDVYINLTFHHDNSTEGFDEMIGNDVHVHLYKDDSLCRTFRVPYADIRGGRKFRIRKTFDGGFTIAAWAVPKDGNENMIPLAGEHPYFSTATIGHKNMARSETLHCSSLDDLFLGVVKENSNDTPPDAHYAVSMKNTLCKVSVFVDPVLFEESSVQGDPNIHIRGTAQGETLEMESHGEEVCVRTTLDQKTSDGMITANAVGVMPAYNNQYVSVTAKSGDVAVFSVETGELSGPGKEITILVKGLTAEIKVNGWRVKTTSVIFNK